MNGNCSHLWLHHAHTTLLWVPVHLPPAVGSHPRVLLLSCYITAATYLSSPIKARKSLLEDLQTSLNQSNGDGSDCHHMTLHVLTVPLFGKNSSPNY